MIGSPEAWAALVAAVLLLLVIDLWFMRGRGGAMPAGLAARASVFWVALALAFGGLLLVLGESEAAGAYFAGYLVEKSLSLDNVFVFLLLFGAFAIAESRAPPAAHLRDRRRARPARGLHRRRRGGARGVRLAQLRLRRDPAVDRAGGCGSTATTTAARRSWSRGSGPGCRSPTATTASG